MDAGTIRAWLALHRLPRLRSRSLNTLLNEHQNAPGILSASAESLRLAGASQGFIDAAKSWRSDSELNRKLDQDEAQIEAQGIQLLDRHSDDYPALLLETDDAPPVLYVGGDVGLLNKPQLAVVGSRQCSRSGESNAESLAYELCAAGLSICSGMALGIDTAAHRGALAGRTGDASTVAVLGCGVDIIYPRRNADLYQELMAKGAVISEFPLGTPPRREQFPRRNRLISGMSLGVLVVEAALRSGSLITARLALEQNREVFALPGAIQNPTSAGCNRLLQQGAQLVTCAADIVAGLPHWVSDTPLPGQASSEAYTCTAAEAGPSLLMSIGYEPTPVEVILADSGLDIAELQAQLAALELEGKLERFGAAWRRI